MTAEQLTEKIVAGLTNEFFEGPVGKADAIAMCEIINPIVLKAIE